jgi:hypothetical protein
MVLSVNTESPSAAGLRTSQSIALGAQTAERWQDISKKKLELSEWMSDTQKKMRETAVKAKTSEFEAADIESKYEIENAEEIAAEKDAVRRANIGVAEQQIEDQGRMKTIQATSHIDTPEEYAEWVAAKGYEGLAGLEGFDPELDPVAGLKALRMTERVLRRNMGSQLGTTTQAGIDLERAQAEAQIAAASQERIKAAERAEARKQNNIDILSDEFIKDPNQWKLGESMTETAARVDTMFTLSHPGLTEEERGHLNRETVGLANRRMKQEIDAYNRQILNMKQEIANNPMGYTTMTAVPPLDWDAIVRQSATSIRQNYEKYGTSFFLPGEDQSGVIQRRIKSDPTVIGLMGEGKLSDETIEKVVTEQIDEAVRQGTPLLSITLPSGQEIPLRGDLTTKRPYEAEGFDFPYMNLGTTAGASL